MEESLKLLIEKCARDSYAGVRSFGEIVGALAAAGIESYQADYRTPATTYYAPAGHARVLPLHAPDIEIPDVFDQQALQAAIRGAQRGEVKYPEFLKLSMAAGCVGYIVWIVGRHVSYFGRRGETHIERFPT